MKCEKKVKCNSSCANEYVCSSLSSYYYNDDFETILIKDIAQHADVLFHIINDKL